MELEFATLAGGCFWCLEAVFNQVRGVHKVVSGYTGGHVPNPTYQQVCSESTGHAEAIQITYDPAVIDYNGILSVFFGIHDPTTKDRQGNDIGHSYRSAIFAHSQGQFSQAKAMIEELEGQNSWPNPIVTEVNRLTDFYPAEDYHHDYYVRNPANPYCQVVISPKVQKFMRHFPALLK